MKTKSVFGVLVLIIALFGGIDNARACTCAAAPPFCGGFKTTGVVFAGEAMRRFTLGKGRTGVEFKVLEAFNNVNSESVVIELGGPCDSSFKLGEKYLIDGNEYQGNIHAGLCTRTRRLSEAGNDLEILRTLKARKPVLPRLFGRVSVYRGENEDDPLLMFRTKVFAKSEGGKSYETGTDAAGNYHFVNLPTGKYHLQTIYKGEFIKNADVALKSAKSGGQCTEANFYFIEGGVIRGRVVDNEGKPIAKMRVSVEKILLSPDDTKFSGLGSDETDENGNYEIEGLRKGIYILRANDNLPLKRDFPFPPIYYPNGILLEQAKRIEVTDEKILTGYDFQMLPRLKTKWITGTALYTNGKPISEAIIVAKEEKSNWEVATAYAEKDGRFTMEVVEGQSYYLYLYKAPHFKNASRASKEVYISDKDKNAPLKIMIHPVE